MNADDFIVRYGEVDDKELVAYFISNEALERYQNNTHDVKLGISFQHETDKKIVAFWFDTMEQKENWMDENRQFYKTLEDQRASEILIL